MRRRSSDKKETQSNACVWTRLLWLSCLNLALGCGQPSNSFELSGLNPSAITTEEHRVAVEPERDSAVIAFKANDTRGPDDNDRSASSPIDSAELEAQYQSAAAQGLGLERLQLTETAEGVRYIPFWNRAVRDTRFSTQVPLTQLSADVRRESRSGYAVRTLDVYRLNDEPHAAIVWHPASGDQVLIGPLDFRSFAYEQERMNDQGYHATAFSLVRSEEAMEYIAVFETSGGGVIDEAKPWTDFLSDHREMERQGFQLAELTSHIASGTRLFAGVWTPGTESVEFQHVAPADTFGASGIFLPAELIDRSVLTIDVPDELLNWKPSPGGNPGGAPGSGNWEDYEFPTVPDHIKLTDNSFRIVVDFTDDERIYIPKWLVEYLPRVDGEIVWPDNYCGFDVMKARRFVWFDTSGQPITLHEILGYIPENSSWEEIYGFEDYADGVTIRPTSVGCSSTNRYPFPLSKTDFNIHDHVSQLVIELDYGVSGLWFRTGGVPSHTWSKPDDLWKDAKSFFHALLSLIYGSLVEIELVQAFCDYYASTDPAGNSGCVDEYYKAIAKAYGLPYPF